MVWMLWIILLSKKRKQGPYRTKGSESSQCLSPLFVFYFWSKEDCSRGSTDNLGYMLVWWDTDETALKNLLSLELTPYIFYSESTLFEFRSIHNTVQSTKFTPLQCQLVKFWICAEFLDTKLSKKSNFETPEGVPTGIPSKISNYGDYALVLFISQRKKRTCSLGLGFVSILTLTLTLKQHS